MPFNNINGIEGFKLIHQGKIRDIYQYDEGQILIITSDRISAFDFVFDDEIAGKGNILTSITKHWFKKTREIIDNHFIDEEPKLKNEYIGRAMLATKADVIPFEAIVRGYLTGSAWQEYRKNKTIGGEKTTKVYNEYDELESPCFTPTTKAKLGNKDQPINFSKMEASIGLDLAKKIRSCSLELFEYAREIYKKKGIMLVDTKFEFGLNTSGKLILIDEIFTPDCSRFWMENDVLKGSYNSYDKQIFRNYLTNNGWNNNQIKLSDDIKKLIINSYKTIHDKIIDGS